IICESAYSCGRLATVPAQEFNCGSPGYSRLIVGMPSIQLGDNIPRDMCNGLAPGDYSRKIDLNGIDAGNMMHDDADRATVPSVIRQWCAPLHFRKPLRKGSETGTITV